MAEEIRHILDNLDRLTQSTQVKSNSASASGSSSNATIWAKGTGYAIGPVGYNASYSNGSNGRAEEEKVITLLKSLMKLMKPEHEFPEEVNDLLMKSSLIPVVSSYLRNTSVLDIESRISQYRVILEFIRSVAAAPQLRFLLISGEGDSTISKLVIGLKTTVDDYCKLLKASKAKDSDVVRLNRDIQATTTQVEVAVKGLLPAKHESSGEAETKDSSGVSGVVGALSTVAPLKTLEERYVEEMKKLQFAFVEMLTSGPVFTVPYYYEGEVRKNFGQAGRIIHARARRLAQESTILSSSLPLSYGSSIFVRCDNDRLDVIKVLITGPAGTPYSNGCFEFDVHFPLDYPNSPPMIHFMTTGRNTARFNPNLYLDGKVCLSILNTWPGSPEEQWNPKTSTLLPVLVAIQAMIFVEHPFGNKPGMESAFTSIEARLNWSESYNLNVRNYTLSWAILEQIRNPTSCFKEIIHRHFWMKREELLAQLTKWKANEQTKDAIKRELMQMKPPVGLEDLKIPLKRQNDDKFKETVPSKKPKGKCCLQ